MHYYDDYFYTVCWSVRHGCVVRLLWDGQAVGHEDRGTDGQL